MRNTSKGHLFFFDKQTHILAKGKTPQSIQEVYEATGASQAYQRNNKKPTNPYLEAIHSRKPIRERDSAPLYNFAHPHRLQTKEFFIQRPS